MPKESQKNSNCHGRGSSRGGALPLYLTGDFIYLTTRVGTGWMEKAYPMSADLNVDFNKLREGNMSLMVIHEGTIKT